MPRALPPVNANANANADGTTGSPRTPKPRLSASVVESVAGFSAGQANTVFVGVPMILKAYGDEGAVPLFLLIAIHLPVTMTLATILAEGRQASPAIVLRRLFTHPIVVGILAGSACRPIASSVPAPAWQVMDLLASAAVEARQSARSTRVQSCRGPRVTTIPTTTGAITTSA